LYNAGAGTPDTAALSAAPAVLASANYPGASVFNAQAKTIFTNVYDTGFNNLGLSETRVKADISNCFVRIY